MTEILIWLAVTELFIGVPLYVYFKADGRNPWPAFVPWYNFYLLMISLKKDASTSGMMSLLLVVCELAPSLNVFFRFPPGLLIAATIGVFAAHGFISSGFENRFHNYAGLAFFFPSIAALCAGLKLQRSGDGLDVSNESGSVDAAPQGDEAITIATDVETEKPIIVDSVDLRNTEKTHVGNNVKRQLSNDGDKSTSNHSKGTDKRVSAVSEKPTINGYVIEPIGSLRMDGDGRSEADVSKIRTLTIICALLAAVSIGAIVFAVVQMNAATEKAVADEQKIHEIQDKKNALLDENAELSNYKEAMTEFYLEYVAIMWVGDDVYYHRYGCPKTTEYTQFRLSTQSGAKEAGYKKCPKCFKKKPEQFMKKVYSW